MPVTLPPIAGNIRVNDAPGGNLLLEAWEAEFHQTKIDNLSPAPAPDSLSGDELERLIRAPSTGGGIDSPMLATGPGLDLDSTIGLRLFGAGGTLTVKLDRATGSVYFGGDFEAAGDSLLHGTVTIEDLLTVNADSEIDGTLTIMADLTTWGTFTVMANGAPVLVADSGGLELVGRFETGTGNIWLEDNMIGVGATTITFSGDSVQFSDTVTVGGSFQVTSTSTFTGTSTFNDDAIFNDNMTVEGVAQFNSTVRLGNAATDTVAMFGGTGVSRTTITGNRGAAGPGGALNQLLNYLQTRGDIINGST